MSSGGSKGTTTYTSNLPKELMPLAVKAGQASWEEAQRDYVPYGGERTAGFDPMQQQAYQRAGSQQVPGQIGQASDVAYGAAQGPSAFGQQGMGYMGLAGGMGMNAGQQYTPGEQYAMGQMLNQGQPTAQGQMGMGGIASGMQGSQTGRWTDPGVAQSYMSPYMQNVIDIQKTKAANDFSQMSQNQRARTGMQGGVGGIGGYRDQINAATTNASFQKQLQDIQGQGLQDAYQSGSQIYGNDEQRALAAAQQRGQLGGMLSQEARAGQGMGLQGYQGYLQGAQGIAGREMDQARLMGTLGGQMSDQARQQQALSLDAARAMGTLGGQQFDMQRNITADMDKYGGQQQAQRQKILDQQYQDFLTQQDWGRNQLNWFNQQLRGGNIASSSMRSDPAPSPISQAAGAGLTGAAIYNMTK